MKPIHQFFDESNNISKIKCNCGVAITDWQKVIENCKIESNTKVKKTAVGNYIVFSYYIDIINNDVWITTWDGMPLFKQYRSDTQVVKPKAKPSHDIYKEAILRADNNSELLDKLIIKIATLKSKYLSDEQE